MEFQPKKLKPIRIIVQSPDPQNGSIANNFSPNLSFISKDGQLVPFNSQGDLMRVTPKKIANSFTYENSLVSFNEKANKNFNLPTFEASNAPKIENLFSKLRSAMSTPKGFYITIASFLSCMIVTGVVTSVVTNYLTLENNVTKGGFCYNDKSCIEGKDLYCTKSVCTCKDGYFWDNTKCTLMTSNSCTQKVAVNPQMFKSPYLNLSITSVSGALSFSSDYKDIIEITNNGDSYFYYVDLQYTKTFKFSKTFSHIFSTDSSEYSYYSKAYTLVTNCKSIILIDYQKLNYNWFYSSSSYSSFTYTSLKSIDLNLNRLTRFFICFSDGCLANNIRGAFYDHDTGYYYISVDASPNDIIYVFDENYNTIQVIPITNYNLFFFDSYDGYIYVSTSNGVFLVIKNGVIYRTINVQCTSTIFRFAIDKNGLIIYACASDGTLNCIDQSGNRVGIKINSGVSNANSVYLDSFGRLIVYSQSSNRINVFTV